MGFFGNFAFSGGAWACEKPNGAPSLVIDIHDSDFATVDFAPATGGASGRFYLGVEPRIYFEDNKANAPVDAAAEARGFAEWVRQVKGRDVDPAAIERLLASAASDAEPQDVFVEETVEKLLVLCGLPLPDELSDAPLQGDDIALPAPAPAPGVSRDSVSPQAPRTDRMSFLRDLEAIAAAVAAPLGDARKSGPRVFQAARGDLTWRVAVEAEKAQYPGSFRLLWGVAVPGIWEQVRSPQEYPRLSERQYRSTLWQDDVEALATRRPRIYVYRIGARPGRIARLNPFSPRLTLPREEMAMRLRALVEKTVVPLADSVTTRDQLANWLEAKHQESLGTYSAELAAAVAAALRQP